MEEPHPIDPPEISTRPLLGKTRHLTRGIKYHLHLPITLQIPPPPQVLLLRYTLNQEVKLNRTYVLLSSVLRILLVPQVIPWKWRMRRLCIFLLALEPV